MAALRPPLSCTSRGSLFVLFMSFYLFSFSISQFFIFWLVSYLSPLGCLFLSLLLLSLSSLSSLLLLSLSSSSSPLLLSLFVELSFATLSLRRISDFFVVFFKKNFFANIEPSCWHINQTHWRPLGATGQSPLAGQTDWFWSALWRDCSASCIEETRGLLYRGD